MYSIYLRVIKSSQHGKMPFQWNDAIRAIEDSECEDATRAALAVGVAIGTHQERERRRQKKSIIEGIQDQWNDDGSAVHAMRCAHKGARFKKVSRAVAKVYGSDDIFTMAASDIEDAAFNAGFARALQMFAEAKRICEGMNAGGGNQ